MNSLAQLHKALKGENKTSQEIANSQHRLKNVLTELVDNERFKKMMRQVSIEISSKKKSGKS